MRIFTFLAAALLTLGALTATAQKSAPAPKAAPAAVAPAAAAPTAAATPAAAPATAATPAAVSLTAEDANAWLDGYMPYALHTGDIAGAVVAIVKDGQILTERGVEGFITVDMQLREAPSLPTVAVAGHRVLPGVTNIVLDHQHAARVALRHLLELGHRDIAFMKGQPFSSDSTDRWQAICEAAKELQLEIKPELTVQIDIDDPTPQLGYPFAKQLLERGKPFTALFAYNDISAMGAIRAFQEQGLLVPRNISVVGFDDIQGAAYNTPSLTTVRQPLVRMGTIAAQILLERIEGREDYPTEIAIQPELMVRESTGSPAK